MKSFALAIPAVLLVGVSSQTAAQAQTMPPSATNAESEPDVAEIVVTAQKRSESLSKVPMSITAITGDQLVQRGVNSVQDLVKLTPGLSFVESGTAVPVFSLRGVGFFDTSTGARPTVSVYINEAPLPFSVMAAGAAFDLDHVEVLKGPQGTLFGQNATGGAINYIAAKPKSEFGAGVTASYARFNTADIQGYVTGPLSPDVDVRVAVRGVRSGGWQKSYTRHDTLGDQDFTQARFLLDWRVSDKLKVSLNLNGFIDNGDTQAGQFIATNPSKTPAQLAPLPLLGNYPRAPQNDRAADWDVGRDLRRDNDFYQANLRADYELSEGLTLTSLTSYAHMNIDQLVDTDGTTNINSLFHVKSALSTVSQEVRLTGDYGPLRFILGANYAYDKADENDLSTFPYSTIANATVTNSVALSALQKFDTKAVFGNIDYDVTDTLTVHGGVRYTKTDLDYAACSRIVDDHDAASYTVLFNRIRGAVGLPALAPLRTGQCLSLDAGLNPSELKGEFNQDNVSWRVGIDFKPMTTTLIYANVSRGYKAGSIPVVAATSAAQSKPVNQESVLAYEVGFKTALANRLVNISGALFYYKYDDKQLRGRVVSTPNILGPLESLINVPKSRIKGAEAQITVNPVSGLSLTAAGTYLDSKVTSNFQNYSILGQLQNFQGSPFPYTPKWQIVLGGQYEFPLGGNLNGLLGADYNYRSRTKAGFGENALLDIRAYDTLDLRAGVGAPDGKWRFQLFGRNVANTYYWTNVGVYVDSVRRLAGNPSTYGVQLSYRF